MALAVRMKTSPVRSPPPARIGSIVGLNSTLDSTVTATSINRIQVLGAGAADISTTTGNLTLDVGNGGVGVPASVTVGGDLNLTVSGGGLNGAFIAAAILIWESAAVGLLMVASSKPATVFPARARARRI